MALLVGLGNPGPRYEANRHNIGFIAVDAICDRHGFGPWRTRHHGLMAEGTIASHRVRALKPLTFMNDSGRSVAAAAHYYRIPNEAIFVLHDEIDLRAGKVRVKRGGGSAGHNGLRSIDAHLGADYWRIRIGVGHPGDRERVHGHVLNDFAKADRGWLDKLLDALATCAPLLIENRDSDFMSKIAMLTAPPKPPKPPKPPEAPETPPAPTEEGEPDDGV